MSEQPTNIYNLNEYRQPNDGSLEMDHQTDVWLKASQLPLSAVSTEPAPARELTEYEKSIIEIHMAAKKLQSLNEERLRRQAA